MIQYIPPLPSQVKKTVVPAPEPPKSHGPELNGDGNISLRDDEEDDDDEFECGKCHAIFETMPALTSHMTRTNCERKPNSHKAAAAKDEEDFDATVDSVSELIRTCEDCGEDFEAEEDAKTCGQCKGKEEEEPAAEGGGDLNSSGGSPESGGQR